MKKMKSRIFVKYRNNKYLGSIENTFSAEHSLLFCY